MTDKKPRGGARPGAGRPPKHPAGPMKQATVRLPEEWQADLRAEFGSLQAGVEALVNAHRAVKTKVPESDEERQKRIEQTIFDDFFDEEFD